MSLTARIQNARLGIRERTRLLRRVRRLYFRIIYMHVMTDPSNATLMFCAERMIECGMYAEVNGLKATRQAILRAMFRIDQQDGRIGRDTFAWHRWVRQHQVAMCDGTFAQRAAVA